MDEEEEDEGGKEKEEEEREAGGSSASTPVLALPPRGEANLTLVHKSSKILETPKNPAQLLLLTSLTSLLLNIHSICFPIRTITSNHIKP